MCNSRTERKREKKGKGDIKNFWIDMNLHTVKDINHLNVIKGKFHRF